MITGRVTQKKPHRPINLGSGKSTARGAVLTTPPPPFGPSIRGAGTFPAFGGAGAFPDFARTGTFADFARTGTLESPNHYVVSIDPRVQP